VVDGITGVLTDLLKKIDTPVVLIVSVADVTRHGKSCQLLCFDDRFPLNTYLLLACDEATAAAVVSAKNGSGERIAFDATFAISARLDATEVFYGRDRDAFWRTRIAMNPRPYSKSRAHSRRSSYAAVAAS